MNDLLTYAGKCSALSANLSMLFEIEESAHVRVGVLVDHLANEIIKKSEKREEATEQVIEALTQIIGLKIKRNEGKNG